MFWVCGCGLLAVAVRGFGFLLEFCFLPVLRCMLVVVDVCGGLASCGCLLIVLLRVYESDCLV